MTLTRCRRKRFAPAVVALWMGLAGREAAQAPAMSVTPKDSTIAVGQTQQFSVSGASSTAPTGVSAGGEYTCVRLQDGTVQCTGRNQFGQLANGTIDNSSSLGPVSNLTNAAAVIAGDEFACALIADGTAKCWGLGEKGQRGDGTYDQRSVVPVGVTGLANAVEVAAGYNHTCARLSSGAMRCWGDNAQGQLGNPTVAVDSSVPVAVNGISGALAITTGAFHTCALMPDRTVRCWGRNEVGAVGDGTYTNRYTPVPVNNLSGVVAISGGGWHTCAVLANGTMRCWGNGYDGQLGNGAWDATTTPVPVSGITNAVGVSAGWAHTCALLQDGTVRCWGWNASGQLGNGTTQSTNTPVAVSGLTGATGITAGWWQHSCALRGDGSVRCWGGNPWGQFGNGTTMGSTIPVAMSGSGPGVTWTSSNTAVATINASGRATGVGSGITTITATDGTGASASTSLTVTEAPPPPPPQTRYTLTVTKSGLASGTGTVTSSPSGINCGSDCSEQYNEDSVVTLTASGFLFSAWTGCDTASGATCTVTMRSARSVNARFGM